MTTDDLRESIKAEYVRGIGPMHRKLEHTAAIVLAFLCAPLPCAKGCDQPAIIHDLHPRDGGLFCRNHAGAHQLLNA